MFGLIKMAALSAALSYSAVTAYNLPVQKLEAAVSGKYRDRILPGAEDAAASETVDQARATGTGKGDRTVTRSQPAVQLITIDSREGVNTSVLTRVPQISVAGR